MSSQRVKEDADVTPIGRDKVARKTRFGWRVYEDGSYYSQTSGGVMASGRVMRDADDKPVQFQTFEEAAAWVHGGCRITDQRGEPITLSKGKTA